MPWRTYAKTVGTTQLEVARNNPERTTVKFFNNSTGIVYIFPNTEQGTGDGYPVPAGCEIVFSKEYGDDVSGEYRAVGDAASLDVRVQEQIGQKRYGVM